MENTMMNSQSAAAVNSANITLNAWSMSETAWKSMEINDETFDEFKLSVDSLYMFIVRAISDSKINSCFILKDSSSQECGYCFCFSKNEDGYIVVTEEWSGSDHEYYMGDRKRFTFGNISDFADRLCDIIADYYYGIYAVEENITEDEISEAPALEEAPELEEAPSLDEDDDITEEGYSVAGLEYLAETMPVVPVDAIVEGVNEYFSDCYAVARNRCMGFYECNFEEFCDIVWSYVWPNIMTDDALEAETRYYMEFNDRLRYMLDNGELGALYIYNNDFVRSRFDEEAEVAA